jgi:hypothetical protein
MGGKALKRLLLFVAACASAVTFAASAAAAARDPFTGVWVGIESPVGDGSTDVMAISGASAGGTRTWLYYETDASGYCGGGPLSAAGTATASGVVLTVTVTATHCFNGSPGSFPPPFQLTMISLGNGEIDSGGVIFNRAGAN